MKIKAAKQKNFNTSTMTSSGNYDAEFAEEISVKGKANAKQHKVKNDY